MRLPAQKVQVTYGETRQLLSGFPGYHDERAHHKERLCRARTRAAPGFDATAFFGVNNS